MKASIIAAVYIVAFFLTWGYGYNRCPAGSIGRADKDRYCTMMILSPLWPIYWTGRFAIYVTEQ